MAKATIKNFVHNGKVTNLYLVVKTILLNDNYCQRKYLDELFNNWQSLSYVLDKFDGFIKTANQILNENDFMLEDTNK